MADPTNAMSEVAFREPIVAIRWDGTEETLAAIRAAFCPKDEDEIGPTIYRR